MSPLGRASRQSSPGFPVPVVEFPANPDMALGALLAEVSHLRKVVGCAPNGADEGSGLARTCAELLDTIGEPPDDSTGREGSGLRGQLAQLVRSHERATKNTRVLVLALGVLCAVAQALPALLQFVHG